jgi:hypothetical protein
MDAQIVVTVEEAGADPARLEELALQLRTELLDTDARDVTRLHEGEAPPGTRAAELAAVGGLLVSTATSLTSLSQIIDVVRQWLRRGHPQQPGAESPAQGRSVELTLGQNTLRLSMASEEEQAKLIAAFLHAATSDAT